MAIGWQVDRQHLANETARLSNLLIREKFKHEGRITAIDQRRRLVEIDMGSDDGVKIGDILDVRRGSDFIAEVVIVERGPDKSVAEIKIQLRRRSIQKGDRAVLEYYKPSDP
jgi:hypothetical protein